MDKNLNIFEMVSLYEFVVNLIEDIENDLPLNESLHSIALLIES